MKLTEKDREFLELLRGLMQSHDLSVELKNDRPSYMVLRGTYGDKINRAFRMTRQGVRWRFQRVFNDIYVAAFSTILLIEKTFGTELREHAIRISKERYALRQELMSGTGLERERGSERDERAPSGERR
ncbi:MAG: hypothetical protein WBE26_18945 [Phycisphaerae bacterium]